MSFADEKELAGRVAVIRREAEALSALGRAYPALWRNAERVLACARMMELDLGLIPENGAETE